jgi:site-specific DNA recombinase
VYLGKVRYRDEVHPGEQAPIIDDQLWQKVQSMLAHNGRTGGAGQRNKHGALLKGLLRCSCCQCSMGHSYTSKGSKRYRYYVCLNAQKRGWDACPSGSIPAGEIERFVVEQIRTIGSDPELLTQTIEQTRRQRDCALRQLKNEQQSVERAVKRHNIDIAKLAIDPKRVDQVVALQERIRQAEQRLTTVREQVANISADLIDEDDVAAALASFDPVWETLSPREQARVVRLLVERAEYDGQKQTVSVTFRPGGIKALARVPQQIAEVAA